MKTEVVRVDPLRPEPDVIARAVRILTAGGLVVLPTETVYGLGAAADDAASVARIFEAKGRPAYNPLIVHVANVRAARDLASRWPESAERITHHAWPGPLTVVVPRNRAKVPDVVTAGGDTVALRMPDHPVALALLSALGRPIAAPSANRFQALSPTTAAHVLKNLDGHVELILDAGPCDRGIESTVVDCTGEVPVVLRHGAYSLATLRRLAGGLQSAHEPNENDAAALRSPGLLRLHYAPNARLVIARPETLAHALREAGERRALVTHRAPTENFAPAEVCTLPSDPEGYGAALYATLHRLDDAGVHTIVVEAVPDDEAWSAIRDRLARASG